MKGRPDLIDHLAGLVAEANNPRRLAERTLDIVVTLVNARSAALFTRSGDALSLFASSSLDQHALDAIGQVWLESRAALERGETVSRPEWPATVTGDGPKSVAVVPMADAHGEVFVLLYVDGSESHFCSAGDLGRLSKFQPVVLRSIDSAGAATEGPKQGGNWEEYLARTPVEDMEREKLLLLLARNEWNIARVARLMGVTRRTIYLRLQRHHIPRERVPKSRGSSKA